TATIFMDMVVSPYRYGSPSGLLPMDLYRQGTGFPAARRRDLRAMRGDLFDQLLVELEVGPEGPVDLLGKEKYPERPRGQKGPERNVPHAALHDEPADAEERPPEAADQEGEQHPPPAEHRADHRHELDVPEAHGLFFPFRLHPLAEDDLPEDADRVKG